jgi:formamidopyrimidine-DNA glycosylase
MPELPEVETIVREMRDLSLIGLEIERASVFWDRSIASHSPTAFCQRIAHQAILDIQRRGKFLVFTLSKDTLLVHLRMTGKFIIDSENSSPSLHERVRLCLSDNRILHYEDQRKFGKWYLADSEKILNEIGIEPLSTDFTLASFKNLLEGRHRQIKPFLLDQHFVAGLGNIYADEALWAAKIHPVRSTQTLTEKEIMALHKAIIQVLQEGVDNIGTSLGATRANYYSVSGRRGNNQQKLKVFRRDGLPCPRCRTAIKKTVVAQRGTHFCPKCQLSR